MSISRRSFLNNSAAFGFLSTLLANSELGIALDIPTAERTSQPTAGEIYWKNLYAGRLVRAAAATEYRMRTAIRELSTAATRTR